MEYQGGQGLKENRVCKVHQDTMAQTVRRVHPAESLIQCMASVTSTLLEQDAKINASCSAFPHSSYWAFFGDSGTKGKHACPTKI